jgi:hypothetical protein
MTEKTSKKGTSALPPLDPAKAENAKQQVAEVQQGLNQGREGKWRIVQAYLALASDDTYQHYEHVVGGKKVRYRSLDQFFSKLFELSMRTLGRWVESAKAFEREVFLKHGTTKLSTLLTIAPLAGISPIPKDPTDVLIAVPTKKGKPPVQKKFGECSKKETEAALRALKGAPSPKLPEAVGIIEAQIKATYQESAGPDAPDLFKIRQAKDKSIEMAAQGWLPLTRASGEALIALGKAIVAATDLHPETIQANAPPPPAKPLDPLAAMREQLAKLEALYASQLRPLVGQQLKLFDEMMSALKDRGVPPFEMAQRTSKLAAALNPGKPDCGKEAAETAKKYCQLREEYAVASIDAGAKTTQAAPKGDGRQGPPPPPHGKAGSTDARP